MLLIGSRAAKYHFPQFRKPKDYDFICTEAEAQQFLSQFQYEDTSKHNKKRRAKISLNGRIRHFEFELVEHYPSSEIIYKNDSGPKVRDLKLNQVYQVASPTTLLLLKKSHITYNIHWWKNIYDYLFFRTKIINKESSWQQEAYKLRYKEVSQRIRFREMNFEMDNSDFFKKSEKFVNRIVEHDSLHRATCFYDEPLFLRAKEDVSKASLSKIKVAQLSKLLKIQMIQEEAMALSLERGVIPALVKNEPFDSKEIYKQYCGKMVYNYLPRFLRLFAANNFLEILDLKKDYVQNCLENHPNLHKLIKQSL